MEALGYAIIGVKRKPRPSKRPNQAQNFQKKLRVLGTFATYIRDIFNTTNAAISLHLANGETQSGVSDLRNASKISHHIWS